MNWMLNVETKEISVSNLPETQNQKIIGVVCSDIDQPKIYIVYENSLLVIYELNGAVIQVLELENSDYIPSTLYHDKLYLYIGFENGTTEVRDLRNNCTFLKITSTKDPGGPGNPKILSMCATIQYLLVNTKENGLLIYIQPAIIFYKWILIELETTIKSFTIHNEMLFVLTKFNEIHLLNFQIQRLDEIPVGGYKYVDIEFDGRYLYLATDSSIVVYDMYQKIQLVFSHKFDDKKVVLLSKFPSSIMIVFSDNFSTLLTIIKNNSNTEFSLVPSFKTNIDIKYNFFKSMKFDYPLAYLQREDKEFKIAWFDDDRVFLSSFVS